MAAQQFQMVYRSLFPLGGIATGLDCEVNSASDDFQLVSEQDSFPKYTLIVPIALPSCWRQSSSLSLNMFQARRYYHWPVSNNIEHAISCLFHYREDMAFILSQNQIQDHFFVGSRQLHICVSAQW